VPVLRVPGLTGSKFTGYAIADNQTATIATWDDEQLHELVAELNLEDDFDLGSLGFDDVSLADILTDREVQRDSDLSMGKEYDESAADSVRKAKCPRCGNEFPV